VPLVVLPMRARNGYRGAHEFASGTQVIELPRPERAWASRLVPDRLAEPLAPAEGAPAYLGPFRVEGSLRQGDDEHVLVGVDGGLDRRVLLWLRGTGAAVLGVVRREVARLTRPRWLAHGTQDGRQWDAFVAPTGAPLPEVVERGGPLPWREARSLLLPLAEELTAACAEGTLPAVLTCDQVWVGPGGQVKLLDVPLAPGRPPPEASADERALTLLREVAALALQGRPPGAPPEPIRLALPPYAVVPLNRLMGAGSSYHRVDEFRTDLAAVRDRPAAVSRRKRLAYTAIQGGLLLLGLVVMILATFFLPGGWGVWAFLALPGVGIAVAAYARGGLSEALGSVALVRSDGRPAARWQAAWRALLIWAQTYGAFFGAWAGALRLDRVLGLREWRIDELTTGFAAVVVWQLVAVWLPRRSLSDFLARTYLVPR
jgi:hypothetical protein